MLGIKGPSNAGLGGKIELCAKWIVESKNLVVFTGAGISTDSGLPDFRGPDGVWTRRDHGLPPPPLKVPRSQIKPNPAHYALVNLQKMGKLRFLISQNVDNLHLKSGIDPKTIAELHGNASIMKCLRCDRRFSKEELNWDEDKWGKGYRTSPPISGQPHCPCEGRIVSSVVNFGDSMPEREMEVATRCSEEADLFFVIGSSLAVTPANQMPMYAKRSGAKLIILNQGETPLDSQADLLLRHGIGDTLPAIVKRVEKLIR